MKRKHLLKIRKEFADAKIAGVKPWEIRSTEDRKFHVGDIVIYKVLGEPEHPLNEKLYTITFIYDVAMGLMENYCIFTDKEAEDRKMSDGKERIDALCARIEDVIADLEDIGKQMKYECGEVLDTGCAIGHLREAIKQNKS